MSLNDVLFIFLAFISEIIGTLSGFGSSTFFVPLAQMLQSFHLVLVLTSALHVFANFSRILNFKEGLSWALFLKWALPSIILTAVGAQLNQYVDTHLYKQSLGIGLIIIAVILYVFNSRKKIVDESLEKKSGNTFSLDRAPWWAQPLIALSGFLTGFLGTGGALRGVALASMNLPAQLFIGLSSGIDIGGDILRLGIYLKNGYMDWKHWYYFPLLAIAAFAGIRVAKSILSRMNQTQFYKVVSFFVLVSGITLVFS